MICIWKCEQRVRFIFLIYFFDLHCVRDDKATKDRSSETNHKVRKQKRNRNLWQAECWETHMHRQTNYSVAKYPLMLPFACSQSKMIRFSKLFHHPGRLGETLSTPDNYIKFTYFVLERRKYKALLQALVTAISLFLPRKKKWNKGNEGTQKPLHDQIWRKEVQNVDASHYSDKISAQSVFVSIDMTSGVRSYKMGDESCVQHIWAHETTPR